MTARSVKIGLPDFAQLTRLERAWGMEYNSCDPTSESNKIHCMRRLVWAQIITDVVCGHSKV